MSCDPVVSGGIHFIEDRFALWLNGRIDTDLLYQIVNDTSDIVAGTVDGDICVQDDNAGYANA